ncbi:MAG: enolase C-terminal domain-like protein [Betaproteobacteria bacterium]
MKVIDWSLHFYELPYRREVVWANAVESAGLYALLVLTDDSGARGVAEGTIKATWSGVSPRSLKASLEDFLVPRILGAECDGVAALMQRIEGVPENRLAKAMIDNAAWQIEACRAKEPLWKRWGGSPKVDLTWAVTRQAPKAMAEEAGDVCERYGFRTLKVKGGQRLDIDLAAMREIRVAVGDEVTLYVDANSAYKRSEALAYTLAIRDAGATVSEDPSPLKPDGLFSELQAAAGVPILVDRTCTSALDAAAYLDKGAQALSTKAGRIGFSEAREISVLAEARGAKVALGLYAESALGTLISLQYGAAIPPALQLVAAEQTFYLGIVEQVVTEMPPVKDGRIELPATSDYASLVDWEQVKRFAVPVA